MAKNLETHNSTSDPAKSHIVDLAAQDRFEYKIFELLDSAGPLIRDSEWIRKTIIGIVEINASKRLRQGKQLYGTAQNILKLKHNTSTLFETWLKCLEAATPEKKAMTLVCSDFASLAQSVPPEFAESLFAVLPGLFKIYKREAFVIVPVVVDTLHRLGLHEAGLGYLEFLQKYYRTVSTKTVRELSRVAVVLPSLTDSSLLKQFENVCSPQALRQGDYSDRFISSCARAIGGVPDAFQRPYLSLCIATASQSFGSASFIAVNLPKRLERLPESTKRQWVDSCARIINKVGICSVAFCFGPLHRRFSSCPPEEVRTFVELICEIAAEFGPNAAMDFIEGKTKYGYQIFGLLDAKRKPSTQEGKRIRKAMTGLVAINVAKQLGQGKPMYRTAKRILGLKQVAASPLFEAWLKCLEAAKRSPRAMKSICSDFASLIPALPPDLLTGSLELIRELVRHHGQRAFAIVPTITGMLDGLDSDDESLRYLGFMRKYAVAITNKTARKLSQIGIFLLSPDNSDILEAFETNCSPKSLRQDSDSDRFIRNLCSGLDRIPPGMRRKYVQVCLEAASESFDGASFVSSALPRKVEQLDEAVRVQYLDSCAHLISRVGIRSVAFCFGSLHRRFCSRQPSEVLKIVEVICEIAAKYGPTAAMAFIEQKAQTRRRWI